MKTLEKLNLIQLIEHLDETCSELDNVKFYKTSRGVSVGFRRQGAKIVFYVQEGSGMLSLDDTFDVEVETELTENTFFSNLVELRGSAFQDELIAHHLTNTSVLEERDDESLEFHTVLDNNLVKIWDKKEGFINE